MKLRILLTLLVICRIAYGQNDCSTHLFICTTATGTPAGIGVQELNPGNQGCLATGEHSSVWYAISIASSGALTMQITPAGFTDFDFAVWGPVGINCCPVNTLPRRCSYAIGGGNTTGINSVLNSPQTDTSEGSSGNQWVQDLNVLSGETYIILVDRSMGSGTFTISFGGTAALSCIPPNCTPTFIDQNTNTTPSVEIFPNPFSSSATLLISPIKIQNAELIIYDLFGKEIRYQTVNSNVSIIERKDLQSGIYFYRLISQDKFIASGKIIIQ